MWNACFNQTWRGTIKHEGVFATVFKFDQARITLYGILSPCCVVCWLSFVISPLLCAPKPETNHHGCQPMIMTGINLSIALHVPLSHPIWNGCAPHSRNSSIFPWLHAGPNIAQPAARASEAGFDWQKCLEDKSTSSWGRPGRRPREASFSLRPGSKQILGIIERQKKHQQVVSFHCTIKNIWIDTWQNRTWKMWKEAIQHFRWFLQIEHSHFGNWFGFYIWLV